MQASLRATRLGLHGSVHALAVGETCEQQLLSAADAAEEASSLQQLGWDLDLAQCGGARREDALLLYNSFSRPVKLKLKCIGLM